MEEGLDGILLTLPPSLPYVCFVWHAGELLCYTCIDKANIHFVSPFFYWITCATSLHDKAWLNKLKRLVNNPKAYAQHSASPSHVPSPETMERLQTYLASKFPGCPWLFVHESYDAHFSSLLGSHASSEESGCELLVFLHVLFGYLQREPPFFCPDGFVENSHVGAAHEKMRQYIIRWLSEESVGTNENSTYTAQ